MSENNKFKFSLPVCPLLSFTTLAAQLFAQVPARPLLFISHAAMKRSSSLGKII
jgi:hypothetical protein